MAQHYSVLVEILEKAIHLTSLLHQPPMLKQMIRKHSKLFMLTRFVFLDVDICFELCEEMED